MVILTYYFYILEEIKHFDNHIRLLYTQHNYLGDDESWSAFTPNKFVSMLLFCRLEKCLDKQISASKIKTTGDSIVNIERFTTDKISEIFQRGANVEAHNKRILILGVPGIGKTILSKEIAYQWAHKKLLSEKETVLMLFLRDPNVKKIKDLKDLVHYFYGFSENAIDISTKCSNYIFQLGGSNVTIILDGLDEIPNDVINDTYLRLLLHRKALPSCRIIVTSRPAVSVEFKTRADTEVEIFGFTKENIKVFIENELEKDVQNKVMDYLEKNKNLNDLCHIPFLISALVRIVKEYNELPSNRVRIFNKFVSLTISHFLQNERSDYAILTIEELRKPYGSYLLQLSKYAFDNLENDHLVFTRNDIIKSFPKLANAPENWYRLGLLNAVKSFRIERSNVCVSYNFIHKSIQEFLAAFYVTKLSKTEQLVFIRKYFFNEKYLKMWIMYIGLSKDPYILKHFLSNNKILIGSKWFGITGINKKFDSDIHCSYIFRCYSEVKDFSMCNLVINVNYKLDLSNCILSLNDIDTMIVILGRSTTTHWNELHLSSCNIGEAGFCYLCKGLEKLAESNHEVYFDEINIDNNSLSSNKSIKYLASLLVQCNTQKLYAANNIITMYDANIAYLAMEYGFIAKPLINPLLIIVNRQERAIFCQTENKTIIEYLNTRYTVSGLYYINCHLNDEVIEQLIEKQRMITNLYFCNSKISEYYLKRILSFIPQENHYQFLFVYKAILDSFDVIVMLPEFYFFTFIFLTKISLILCNANYLQINHLIFSNQKLPETNMIQTFCLSYCKLNNVTTKLLVEFLNQCNNLLTLLLFNNNISSNDLKQLMDTIKSKDSLRYVTVQQKKLKEYDAFLLEKVFKKTEILLINDKILRGYLCSDEQFEYASHNVIIPPITILMIRYSNFGYHALVLLNKLFQNCVSLKEIIINYSLIDIPTADVLLKHIGTITTLRVLNLKGNRLTEEAVRPLKYIITNNPGLKELYLGDNQLQLEVTELANTINNISLKVLDLQNNNIPEEAADELSAAIRANTSLEKLWLGGNHLGSSTVMIVDALKEISTIKELNLNDNRCRNEKLALTMTSVLAKNKHIERLSLRDNSLNDDGVINIAQSLCKHSALKVLNLQKNNITEEAAEALASIISSNNLEALYLGNNQLKLNAIKLSTAFKNKSSLKLLDLANNKIPEQVADELSAAIIANNSLEKLWLGCNHLGSSTVMIANALKEISTLKELNLNDNKNVSEQLAPAITSIIVRNTLIERLSLSNNNLNDDGVMKIAQSLCKHSKLKSFNLRCNNITEKSAEALASIISSNTGLEELYLGNNLLQLGVIKISTALKNISSLKVLDLNNNNIPDQVSDELAAAIRANNSLEKLWLSNNHLGLSTVMIVNALKKLSLLKELAINVNENRSKRLAKSISSVISNNKLMETLLLNDSSLGDDGVIKIAQSLCKHSKLKLINLQSNNITEEAAKALASTISSNTGLEELYLGNNQLQLGVIKIATALKSISSLKVLDFNNNNIPEQVADELAAAIRVNNSIEKLWLSDNHLGSSTVMIVNALKEISTLKELNLNGNKNRSEELAPALASIIAKNKLMEILSLSDNNLNDDGVIKIALSLCKHSALKVFNLQNNNITEETAEALASVVSSNNGLEELYLCNNQLQLGAIKLATALKTISSLKVLDLENNTITEHAADELEAAIKANTSLQYLRLSENCLGSSMAVITKDFLGNLSLKQFAIRNSGILEKAANDLAAAIGCNCFIELLSISDNNLQSSGFITIVQSLKATSSLKYLYASDINATSTVSEELSSVIDNNPSLEELSLGNNLLENGLIQIAESCSRLTSLKILELSHNCISPAQAVNLASIVSKFNSLQSLESLSLAGLCLTVNENLYLSKGTSNAFSKEKAINNICFELFRMKICHMSLFNYSQLIFIYNYWYIYISYQHKNKLNHIENNCEIIMQEAKQKLSQINSKAMISSLQIIRTLKVINLENNNIDEDAATELAGHLHCNNILEQLWLRGNELYDKGTSVVLQSLHNLSTLLILDLSFNHLSNQSADDIAVAIGNNCSLEQLWLDGNDLLTSGVMRIACALKKLSSLRILSLCSNGITDDAAEEISNVITSNALLVDLLLGINQLQVTSVCTIAIALRKLFILRTLDLSNNHITPDAAEELAVTLSNCTNLQQLFLNDNMLGTEGTIKIANALKFINSLQVLTLSNNNITESAADVLVDVLKHNISVKIVLIGGNDLRTTGVNLIVQTAKNITTLQLLDVSDNNVSEDEKENFRMIFANYSNFTMVV